MYASAESQLDASEVCELCRSQGLTTPCDPAGGSEVDLLMSGSPCPPFSTQRTKRFADGSVVSHDAFKVTMTTVLLDTF